jgi:lactate permease
MRRMKIPVLVIAQVLGLGFLTRYSGTDAVLGLAFTGAGVFYPSLRPISAGSACS